MIMTEAQLSQIEHRARLYTDWWGLPLSRDDVRDLLAEVAELRALHAHLTAYVHQSLWELGRLGTEDRELLREGQ
jgi:hypothetical protein